MSTYETLPPHEQWMVRSNLDTILSTGVPVAEHAALLRANGYPRIADAVEEMAAQQWPYEEQIKRVIKRAVANGVVWTDKQFAQINADAVAEVSTETARSLYGDAR